MKSTRLSKALTFCKSYIELCVWLLVFAVGIRFFEAILLSYQVNHDFGSSIAWNLTGLCYDISLYLRINIWILIIFVAACFVSEKKTRIILRILQSLMLLLSLIGIVFFATSGYLLDRVVFSYTFKEILFIIQSSSTSPVWVYIVVAALPVLYFFISGKRVKINRLLLTIFAVLTLSSFFIFNKLSLNTDQYHIKVNKEHFFLKSIFKKQSYTFGDGDEDIIKAIEAFRSYFPEHQFVEAEYPFLYKAECKDVLSPFFDLKSEPPNFVFIIVEGLGYDFFKTDYQLMPFLDSLSKKSLSWEHCLSTSPRTFGILPALCGALPLGDKGFMEQSPNNPEHYTLFRILSQNNYTNRFFYGGWIGFDNMHYFAEQNHIAYLQEHDWDTDIINQQIGAYWGYEDHLTYSQALRELNREKTSPRMDLYLSLSTHHPWEYPRSLHFQDVVKRKVTQNKTLSAQQKRDILNSVDIYGCFAYSDWSIQQLMEGYKKRDDFDNTIFIITGDHSAFTKQFGGYTNYHVPLIIYSPMLKSGRNMKGVVSHRDITPTLLALLQNNFDVETPDEVAWLNTALDTSLTFNANTFSPLHLIAHTLGGVVYKNYMLSEGVLEEFTDDVPRKINDPDILQRMNRLLFLYQTLDLYVLNNDALIKNQYAYKATNVIINIEDTIAQESYFAQTSELPIIEGPESHTTTLYFDTSYLYPIEFLHFEVPDINKIEKFQVDIEFKIYIKNDDENKNLNVIMDLADNDKFSLYKYAMLSFDMHNQWYTYKNTITYKKETYASSGKNSFCSIYLWNKNKLEGYIDDIKVKVTVYDKWN